MMFYIPYSLFGIPATILAKRFSSALVIPFLVLGWGSLAMITAATTNFGGIMATRVLLGTMEAGFLPCATFYLSTFYTRRELASRLAVFFQMGFISVSTTHPTLFGLTSAD
jgi:MFS family permease